MLVACTQGAALRVLQLYRSASHGPCTVTPHYIQSGKGAHCQKESSSHSAFAWLECICGVVVEVQPGYLLRTPARVSVEPCDLSVLCLGGPAIRKLCHRSRKPQHSAETHHKLALLLSQHVRCIRSAYTGQTHFGLTCIAIVVTG